MGSLNGQWVYVLLGPWRQLAGRLRRRWHSMTCRAIYARPWNLVNIFGSFARYSVDLAPPGDGAPARVAATAAAAALRHLHGVVITSVRSSGPVLSDCSFMCTCTHSPTHGTFITRFRSSGPAPSDCVIIVYHCPYYTAPGRGRCTSTASSGIRLGRWKQNGILSGIFGG